MGSSFSPEFLKSVVWLHFKQICQLSCHMSLVSSWHGRNKKTTLEKDALNWIKEASPLDMGPWTICFISVIPHFLVYKIGVITPTPCRVLFGASDRNSWALTSHTGSILM